MTRARRAVRRLPDALVNQIAAGEVVERPASVVKELIENSLDAGAARVSVTIRGAGQQLIAVVDDGEGMLREDCHLALERHATSKLGEEADLTRISTLGFRGEALPAIFSVSRLRLASRPPEAPRGYIVAGEAGVIQEAGEAEVPLGTSVEVRDLFFNMPVRSRFLKSPATEQGAILRVITPLVLAHPAVHVRVVANGRPLLTAPAAGTVRERLGTLYGFGMAAKLLDVTAEAGGARLTGLVAPPALARTHREDIHLVVNGRPVRDALLMQALVEAYRPLLPRDQFPVAALRLELAASEVDVNVHPTKAWVRFRHPRTVHDLVLDGVQRALRTLATAPDGLVVRAVDPMPWPSLGAAVTPTSGGEDTAQAALFRESEIVYGAASLFGNLVGQIEDTFIVAHTADEVFFVDQHVAHERVLFERLRSDLDKGPVAGQALLFPQSLELAPARGRALERALPELARLGFELEGFGGQTWLLRAVPSLLRDDEPLRLVDELARELEDEGAGASSPVLDRLLAFVACRAAIKAHQALGREEMARLLADLSATVTPFYCPHGRPVVSRIPLGDIRRELRRTW